MNLSAMASASVSFVLAIVCSGNLWAQETDRGACSPQVVAQLNGSAIDCVVDGSFAYVANGAKGLLILDVSDPASIQKISGLDTPGEANHIAYDAASEIVLIGDVAGGLRIIDVSNPSTPAELASVPSLDGARDVEIVGTLAVVCLSSNGLAVVDISEPDAPQVLGQIDTPGFAESVHVDGTLAYVADSGSGLQIVEMAAPANLSIVGTIDTPSIARDVLVAGDFAYVASGSFFAVIDISSPSSPTLVGDRSTRADRVALFGSDILATAGSTVKRIDVSDPTMPQVIDTFTALRAFNFDLVGTEMYLAALAEGFQVFDLADPLDPESLGTYIERPVEIRHIRVSGNSVLASSVDRLYVLDGTTPADPIILGVYDFESNVRTIGATGDVVCVIRDNGTSPQFGILDVLSVEDPAMPVLLSSLTLDDISPLNLAVLPGRVYVTGADGFDGRSIAIDITDPLSPAILGGRSHNDQSSAVHAVGNRVYVLAGGSLLAYDVTVPPNWEFISELAGFSGFGVAGIESSPDGEVLYVSRDGGGGVKIVDVASPTSPFLLGAIPPASSNGQALGISIDGNLLAVSYEEDGVSLFDISDPRVPEQIGSIDPDGFGIARESVVRGEYLWVAHRELVVAELPGCDVPPVMFPECSRESLIGASPLMTDAGIESSVQRVADVNNDGVPDILGIDFGSRLQVLRSIAPGMYDSIDSYSGAGAATRDALQMGHFNSDAYLDVAVFDFNGGRRVNVFLNDGGGTFTRDTDYTFSDPRGFAVGDINNDGIADLLLGRLQSAGISYRLGNGDGTFAEQVLVLSSVTGGPVSSLTASDFNSDGNLDLAYLIGDGTDLQIGVALGNGDATFQSPFFSSSVTAEFRAMEMFDLNGDGILDALVRTFERVNGISVVDEVFVQEGLGGGLFGPPSLIDVGPLPLSFDAADLDNDGITDLVVSNNDPASFGTPQPLNAVYGIGDLSFEPPVTFSMETFAFPRAADLNLDGSIDLVVGVDGAWKFYFNRCAVSASCPGDCNASGSVDFADLVAILFEFGSGEGPCDTDGSGTVNFADLVAALFTFGPCT